MNCFEETCKILNNIKEPQILRFTEIFEGSLEKDCKARKNEADRGLAISPEYRWIDQILEDYLERRDEEERLSRVQ